MSPPLPPPHPCAPLPPAQADTRWRLVVDKTHDEHHSCCSVLASNGHPLITASRPSLNNQGSPISFSPACCSADLGWRLNEGAGQVRWGWHQGHGRRCWPDCGSSWEERGRSLSSPSCSPALGLPAVPCYPQLTVLTPCPAIQQTTDVIALVIPLSCYC